MTHWAARAIAAARQATIELEEAAASTERVCLETRRETAIGKLKEAIGHLEAWRYVNMYEEARSGHHCNKCCCARCQEARLLDELHSSLEVAAE